MMQDVQEIRGLARDFAGAELRPNAERWDAAGALDDSVIAALAELGFFGMFAGETDGGMGFDLATCLAALEELAWGEPSAALLVAQNIGTADLIARHGGDSLRQRWLEPLVSGEALAGIATPPDASTAPRAQREDEGWRITGTVRWVPGGERASLIIARAAADNGDALFAVPIEGNAGASGRSGTLGLRPIGFAEIFLDGTRVGDDARLGGPDHVPALRVAGMAVSAIAVGVAQAALEHAIAYAAEREQFGRPIRMFEGVRARLADMAVRTVTARTLVEHAARNPDDDVLAAAAAIAAGDAAMFVTDDAVQVFGGYGYMRDYPVEKLMRDAQALPLLTGGADTLRMDVADSLYRQ